MKLKSVAWILLLLEIITFFILCVVFNIPNVLSIRLGLAWFLLLLLNNHYNVRGTLIWKEIGKLIRTALMFIVINCIYLWPDYMTISKYSFIVVLMSITSLYYNRTIRVVLRKQVVRKTLVLGTNYDAYRIGKISHNNRFAVTDVVGYVKVPNEKVCEELQNNKKLNVYEYEEFNDIFKKQHIDQIIVSVTDDSKEALDEISKKVLGKAKYVKFAPELNFTMSYDSYIDDFDGILMISTARESNNMVGKFFKRCFDIAAGIAGCLVLIPLTIYVRHKNRKNGDYDPIFFAQERIGLNGKPIKIYKYRSMVPNAEKVLEDLMESDPEIKKEYLTNKKLVNDPRITEAGEFLRRTSLDEFPQFINVLKGEMSFVGPRPYLPREKEDMDVYYSSIIKCKPGITGMWQANGRSDVGFEERCRLDDYYYKNWTFSLDLIIIFKTIKGVLYGKGAI